MKRKTIFSAILIASSSFAASETITVSAYIDGISSLILQGDTAYWHHTDFAAPGRWNANDFPTTINGYDWVPIWPSEGRNDFCNCNSSSISGLFPTLPSNAITVALNPLDSPGSVSILEQPNLLNGYSLVVQFDDYYRGGASWYNIELSYPSVPLPAAAWLFGMALSALGVIGKKSKKI